MAVSATEKSAWSALDACGIQQTAELSDDFLIATFSELIRRADSTLAWNHSELDELDNKKRIVRYVH